MGATGNQPPAMLPARGKYMREDLRRLQTYFDVGKIQLPSNFPISSLSAQRVLVSLSEEEQQRLAPKLWEFFWQQDKDISKLPIIQQAIEAGLGLSSKEAEDVLARINDPEVKEKLKQNTEEAVRRGAFGAPTIFLFTEDGKEEMFFGSDRFHLLYPALGIPWVGPNPERPASL